MSSDHPPIIGKLVNRPEPANETEHFRICAACGQAFDMRDLGQVFHHFDWDHEPMEVN